MIHLNEPITINPPPFTKPDGSIQTVNPYTMSNLDFAIIDHPSKKTAMAKIFPCPKPLILWQGTDYDNIGDYTQAQVDSRITELLGSNIKASLESLFV